MGYAYSGRCFSTVDDVTDAYFTGRPVEVTSGATSYATEFSKSGGVWESKGYSIDAAGVWTLRYTSAASVPSFPSCDPAESFNDGLILGWGIAFAMVAAWAISHMRRGLGIL